MTARLTVACCRGVQPNATMRTTAPAKPLRGADELQER